MAEQYVQVVPSPEDMNKAIFDALSVTYLAALIERTPAKTGETRGLWELKNPELFQYELINPNGSIVMALEEGTKEHIIKAKEKKMLRFKKRPRKSDYRKIPGNIAFEKDGFIFAKMVRHPGFEARRFMEGIRLDEDLYQEFLSELYKNMGLE